MDNVDLVLMLLLLSHACGSQFIYLGRVDGWVDGWMGGWVGGGERKKMGFSNEGFFLVSVLCASVCDFWS